MDQGRKRISVVTDLREVGEDAGVFVHEHRSELSGSRRVAETAQDLIPTATTSTKHGAAPFGFVAQNPQIARVVGQVRAFVLDIQLPRKNGLAFNLQLIAGNRCKSR